MLSSDPPPPHPASSSPHLPILVVGGDPSPIVLAVFIVSHAIGDLITDANFDYSATGFSLQVMDLTHIALVALFRSKGFEHYHCNCNLSMGMNLNNMAKILKCTSNENIITIQANDSSNTITFMFKSPSKQPLAP